MNINRILPFHIPGPSWQCPQADKNLKKIVRLQFKLLQNFWPSNIAELNFSAQSYAFKTYRKIKLLHNVLSLNHRK